MGIALAAQTVFRINLPINDNQSAAASATTARDLRRIDTVMTPDLLDALSLTRCEIAHRGLSSSISTASFESLRARVLAHLPAPVSGS
jgi:hypothetical protein